MVQSSEIDQSDKKTLPKPALRGDAPGCEPADDIVVERQGGRVTAKWNIKYFAQQNKSSKVLYSKYFVVEGYDCRLLVYPAGDAQALPGYVSVYLQISDPGSNSSKWDCFASYQLAVRNLVDDSKTIGRDSWHRFSAKKRSHGWCDFVALSTLLDPQRGFLGPSGTIQVSTDITILNESVCFSKESDGAGMNAAVGNVYSGTFTWRVHNFSAFQPLLKTQKIMSPSFPAGECALRMSAYQSTVAGVEYLSLCLESKDHDKSLQYRDRSAWCLFRLAVHPQLDKASRTIHRDSYGRFASDSRGGDNTSLGWNDFLCFNDFINVTKGYLVEDTAIFTTSFHVIREATSLTRSLESRLGVNSGMVLARVREKRKSALRDSEWAGRFQWKLENFTRLKEILKKRKITGLCIKSKRFTIGGHDCRLIVYPRGQSQPPKFLSIFLEVSDPHNSSSNWSSFVSHRLSVVNQRGDPDRSVSKESQNRYGKTAKDWGWREFVSLTSLFDADAGFLVNDSVVFAAEVLVLKESMEVKKVPPNCEDSGVSSIKPSGIDPEEKGVMKKIDTDTGSASCDNSTLIDNTKTEKFEKVSCTWRIENFAAFKDVIETRKIFSQFFPLGPCEVRVGLYESFDSLCIYLESDTAAKSPQISQGIRGGEKKDSLQDERARSYWIRYRVAVVNQLYPDLTQWREGSMYSRSWNNSVLQFPQIGNTSSKNIGTIVKDCLVVSTEVLDIRPMPSDNAEVSSSMVHSKSGLTGENSAVADLNEGCNKMPRISLFVPENGENARSESLPSSSQDEEDSNFDEPECNFHSSDAEVEDALARWLSAAGLDLLNLDKHPPILSDPESVQEALEDILDSEPGAIPMFMASLRMYLSSLERVKRLFLPCISSREVSTQTIYSMSPSVITLLMGIVSLRQPLLNVLVDVMLDHTLTAKMHKHLSVENSAEKRDHDRTESEENTYRAQTLEEASENGCQSCPALINTCNSAQNNISKMQMDEDKSKGSDENGVGSIPGLDTISSTNSGSPSTPGRSARISGSLAESHLDEVEQTLGIIIGWLRCIDPKLLCTDSGSEDCNQMHLQSSPLSPLHKVSMLLADAPKPFQSDVIALVPYLVGSTEHTAAAGALLGRLAEASREGPDSEARLRLPVLSALGSLHINPLVANKVLQAALDALPHLTPSELPPAVGLVLKLSSVDHKACKESVAAVHSCIHQSIVDSTLQNSDKIQIEHSGAIEAFRLAAMQQVCVASCMLDLLMDHATSSLNSRKEENFLQVQNPGMEKEGVEMQTLTENQEKQGKHLIDEKLYQSDIHLLLDSFYHKALRKKASRVLCACAASGLIVPEDMVMCLRWRQPNKPDIEDKSENCFAKEGSCNISLFSEWNQFEKIGGYRTDSIFANGAPLPSVAQRIFVQAHSLENTASCLPERIAFQIGLSPNNCESHRHKDKECNAEKQKLDELDGFLEVSEMLLNGKGKEEKKIGTVIIQEIYDLADWESRLHILRFLAQKSLSGLNSNGMNCDVSNGIISTNDVRDFVHRFLEGDVEIIQSSFESNLMVSAPLLALQLLIQLGFISRKQDLRCTLPVAVLYEICFKLLEKMEHLEKEKRDIVALKEKESSQGKSNIEKLKSALGRAEEQINLLEMKSVRQDAELRAELAGAVSDKKRLQNQLRGLEQQLDWMKFERDEERSIRSRENMELQRLIDEAEAQVQRLKTSRREDQKRAQKDKSALLDKLKILEESLEAAELRVSSISREAENVSMKKDELLFEMRRRAETAEHNLSMQAAELLTMKRHNNELEMQLNSAISNKKSLENILASEQKRMALILNGSGVQDLSQQELQVLLGIYQDGMRRIHSMISTRARSMPTTTNSVSEKQQLQTGIHGISLDKTEYSSSSLASKSINEFSMDSSKTMEGSAANLFGDGDWNLRNLKSHQSATQHDDSSLLGLLPSDLLSQS